MKQVVKIETTFGERTLLASCTKCDKSWDNWQTATTYAKLHTIESGHATQVERITLTKYQVKSGGQQKDEASV